MDKLRADYNFQNIEFHSLINKIANIDFLNGKYIVFSRNIDDLKLKDNYLQDSLMAIQTLENFPISKNVAQSIIEKNKNAINAEFATKDWEALRYFEALTHLNNTYNHSELSVEYIEEFNNILNFGIENSNQNNNQNDKENSPTLFRTQEEHQIDSSRDKVQNFIFNRSQQTNLRSELKQLITQLQRDLKDKEVHPLIILPIFAYKFLLLSPFKNYNGRTMLLLIRFLLMKQGYELMKISSLEKIIEQSNREYFQAIMTSQDVPNHQFSQYTNWVRYFLNTLEKLFEITLKELEQLASNKNANIEDKHTTTEPLTYLNKRQKAILNFITKHSPLKISDIFSKFEQVNFNTLKKDVQYLKKEQLIISIGEGKGTIYQAKINE